MLCVLSSLAANIKVKGAVKDKLSKEPLIGATIRLIGTQAGAVTDMDGNFELNAGGVLEGMYDIEIKYVGYKTEVRRKVRVENGKLVILNLELETDAQELADVVVVAKKNRENENMLLLEQQKAVIAVQSVGVKELSRKGVSDAEGAVTKVSGVSKQDGVKNVFVRGLGDRYNATTFNGFSLPSEDPEYKNISLDFFGTDVIQSVGVNKAFNAGGSSDVGGATIDIVSKELIGGGNFGIGISGGLDSTLALIVTVLAFDKLGWDRKRIIGITMPGLGTTTRTHSNASDLMAALGVTSLEIPIGKAVAQHFSDIGQNPEVQDVTYENSQARERTQILMDVANKENGIVVGTGDLSELALGWATYNGDHMSMYAVNASIPKTLVRYLVGWAAENHFESDVAVAAGRGTVGACGGIVGTAGDESACGGVENRGGVGNRGTLPETSRGDSAGRKRSVREILMDIIDTPVSPELKPADSDGNITQKTEDLVGPYELHDFFLYHIFRFGARPSKVYFLARKAFEGIYDDATILKWLNTFIRRFFAQQFKRSCLPDCPKVGSVSLSPRGDWRMPSDAWRTIFLNDLPER